MGWDFNPFTSSAMTMYEMTDLQYQAVYNCLSFALASMMATTMYLWFRSTAVADKYKSAVLISGLVTFIAAYHYIRIFNSWVDAYAYTAGKVVDGALEMQAPTLTGIPFNDAYRYILALDRALALDRDPFGDEARRCCTCRRRHSDWLLHLRHHLQVWCGNCDLPDLVCQDQQGGSFAMKSNGCIPRDAIFPWSLIFFLLGPIAGRLGTYISFPEVA